MTPIYPEERKKLDVIGHLEELRKRILICLAALVIAGAFSFWKGGFLMSLVRRPVNGLVDELIFISPTEAFVAYIKVALLTGFIVSFPLVLYNFWGFIAPALDRRKRYRMLIWLGFALALFLAGILFSYFVAIPAALNFLLNFSEGIAVAKITLGKYISFFGALVLVGGITFEIPIIIGVLADIGLLRASVLRRKRHYAILAILVFAAVITPTQDILNMLIFALPMIILYEIGIVIATLIEKYSR
ncbi:MAG: twin-arginine translocase subunit TatC [Candidatus Omnitrophica bacterium]|nr:twin-arginine translocase subunit TatC [Candidatus Omnitrophota bacterium]